MGAWLWEGTKGGDRSGAPTSLLQGGREHGLLGAGATPEMGTQEEEQVGGIHVSSGRTLKSS